MVISRQTCEQLPLTGLFTPAAPTGVVHRGDQDVIRLGLPNWSTAWEVKTGRGGWPKVEPKTGKVIKHRKVWDALNGNSRNGHYAARHKATKEVIKAVVDAATLAGLRPCQHLTVQLVWAPGDNRRADRGNLNPLQKACLDGLVRGPRKDLPGLHLVPDDTDQWVEELMPRIDRPPTPPGLWLELRLR
jgi:hypothetical protein